jgi:hypothetical protein
MRPLLVLSLFAAPALMACVNQDPAPLFLQTSYQVRCLDCMPVTTDNLARTVAALDGESGFSVACSAQPSGKDRLLSFSVTLIDAKHESNDYSFKIIQADLDKSDPGAACRVVVTEGANAYEGHCTGGDPTTDNPCQITKLRDDHGIVKGNLLCNNIPNRTDANTTRYVVKPSTMTPADFEVHGCVGL